jgi:hypothetical protein
MKSTSAVKTRSTTLVIGGVSVNLSPPRPYKGKIKMADLRKALSKLPPVPGVRVLKA